MTQIAKMILNDLPISKEIQDKINYIKDSKLSFKDFNTFRLLLERLENFEPKQNQSKERYKNEINAKITHLLENLNTLQLKAQESKNAQSHRDTSASPNNSGIEYDNTQTKDSTLSQTLAPHHSERSEESQESDKAKLLSFLAKLEEITSLQEINKEQIGFLLESASALLLNQESLNKNEIELLEEAKETLAKYLFTFQEKTTTIPQEEIQELKNLGMLEAESKSIESQIDTSASSKYDNSSIEYDNNANKTSLYSSHSEGDKPKESLKESQESQPKAYCITKALIPTSNGIKIQNISVTDINGNILKTAEEMDKEESKQSQHSLFPDLENTQTNTRKHRR
ncbi:hypothetical protein [Helicobacter turcicus]|uniref:Uncharacterized protein n=1 Tax=Helicobacter turcicus TaxID=2867412 RepID=A0ABS7JPE5_9HELI|nr:hypothetical protein [Helicobacter turcicus]MBX7491276.1 hypothetical protein [Helicobacter turcicus]MBX7546085.1 hypothetical protein [Helicobacter turcicus]